MQKDYKAIGHLRLDKITPRHVQKFINELSEEERKDALGAKGQKLSAKTVKLHLSLISTVFDYAINNLKTAVDKAYHIICNICRAAAVLWCGKGKFAEYCADFTPKQNALMCAILDYGAKCTREADFSDLADKIDNEYFIADGIREEMIPVEPEPVKQKNDYLSYK